MLKKMKIDPVGEVAKIDEKNAKVDVFGASTLDPENPVHRFTLNFIRMRWTIQCRLNRNNCRNAT